MSRPTSSPQSGDAEQAFPKAYKAYTSPEICAGREERPRWMKRIPILLLIYLGIYIVAGALEGMISTGWRTHHSIFLIDYLAP